MSSLPTLDDLQSKAKTSKDIYRNPYLTLDVKLNSNSPSCTHKPVLITPETDVRKNRGFFKHFTAAFQCSRLKSGFPTYRPIHRQIPSSPSGQTTSWRQWSTIRQACFLLPLICIVAVTFCTGIFFVTTNITSQTISHHDSENHHWYKDAVFYEIYPASFQDTDSDGYGDFQGIIRRLDYIHNLGVTAIRLNSIFSALDYPLEYEHIIDLHNADPHLGRMEDFRRLVKEVHQRGMRIVLDLNPTVTSDQHTWALHWERGIPGYEHFYASHNRSKAPPEMDSTDGPPPEDWELPQRTFGGHYVVNWSNSFVQQEYQKAMAHWIDSGIDGFYMKHLDKLHVLNSHDVVTVLVQWRTELDKSTSTFSKHRHYAKRILIVSSQFINHLEEQRLLCKEVVRNIDLVDFPVLLGEEKKISDVILNIRRVSDWPKISPITMWHLGSSDTFRLASRIDERYSMAAFFMLMTLPGVSSLFYGDEIGLKDSTDSFSNRVYRGGQMTPMQWSVDNSSGGFTDNLTFPWLPVNPDHFSTNVQNQHSRLQELSKIIEFRKTVLKNYKHREHRVEVLDPSIVLLERTHRGRNSKRVIFVANFGNLSEDKAFPEAYGNVKSLLKTPEPTRIRIRKRGFTVSPGAAFVAEVTLLHNSSPTAA